MKTEGGAIFAGLVAALALLPNTGRADDESPGSSPPRTLHLEYTNIQKGVDVNQLSFTCTPDPQNPSNVLSCQAAQHQTSIDSGDWTASIEAYLIWFWPGHGTLLRWAITELQTGTMKGCGTGTIEVTGTGTFDFATNVTHGGPLVIKGVGGDLVEVTGIETAGPGVQQANGDLVQPAIAQVKCR
jgi:hypothetical protein